MYLCLQNHSPTNELTAAFVTFQDINPTKVHKVKQLCTNIVNIKQNNNQLCEMLKVYIKAILRLSQR